ncbi:ABC transporter ATP-binding protein [Bosea psychrotolerans]|uniref:Peptide/nickel transport system ATP-binding protein/oligopeptide transport system ATP-binding protein n=1 Tax=Bosea psychrotolerans TaxID=1871628 RepID=A0A2S4LSM0_9HYPH|nr:oligopeptide/dipeptide ABC transporter ATP-binding protein [Bosea psychrotolerans]POR45405.1 peptide/nickel transport system ATP-binding protein/oligopeptide transport system ATP-binding protein [Bosea psychrotolerans]
MNAPFRLPLTPDAASDDVVIVQNVSRHFGSSRTGLFGRRAAPVVRAVEDVSFRVPRGSCFAIVGESGSGKSSLARLVVGLLRPTSGEVTIGSVALSSLDDAGLRGMRRKVQLVLQDPRASLDPRMTVLDTLAEALTVHSLHRDRQARRERIDAVIGMVGLSQAHLTRYPHELSGGQRQRVAIARAIVCEPEILVLDEPVSALDVSVQAQIINLLADLQARLALTYIVITHDLALVAHMADAVGVMYLGRFVEQGDVGDVCGAPRHPYTQSLMAIAAQVSPLDRDRPATVLEGSIPSPLAIPSGCSFHTRCPRARALAAAGVEAVDTADGRLARLCVEAAPLPHPAPGGRSTAKCHFADQSLPDQSS